VRMLFTFAGGSGHLEPLIPIARAAEAADHVVAFAGRPWMVPKVEALGFPAFATGSDVGLTPKRVPLAAVDLEREIRAIGRGFGHRIARERATDILPLCAAWRPDLLVCEELDFGAMIVAERLALPHATVLVIAAGGFVRPDVVAEPLNEVRAEHGRNPPTSTSSDISPNLCSCPIAASSSPTVARAACWARWPTACRWC
jgi:UDP:flavonoid glycosyltransferase YjiC (YdhE family)